MCMSAGYQYGKEKIYIKYIVLHFSTVDNKVFCDEVGKECFHTWFSCPQAGQGQGQRKVLMRKGLDLLILKHTVNTLYIASPKKKIWGRGGGDM